MTGPGAGGDDLDGALQRAARAPTLLVCLDFDGTLAPLAATPDAARALPAAAQAVRELAGQPRTVVGIVSGRAREDLADLVAQAGMGDRVHLVGSHGAEQGGPGAAPGPRALERLARIVDEARSITDGVPGVLVETKPVSVAVHVRLADRTDAARVLEAVRRGPGSRPGVRMLAGHEVLELSVSEQDKGDAVAALRHRHGADLVVYVGDDVTDELALARLTPKDVGVHVGDGPTRAAHRVAGPAQVAALLARLVELRALSSSSPID